MDLSAAVTAVAATLRRRPADLLPFYLLGTAVPVIARVGSFLALGVVYVHLALSGRLDAALAALSTRDITPPETEDPAALERWAEGLVPVFEQLFTPTTVAVVALGVVATAVIALLAYAAVSAGQMSAVVARLRAERGLTAGIGGVRAHWLTFLGLYVAEFLLWVGVALLASAVVGVAFLANPLLGAVAALGAFLVTLAVLLAIRVVFAFAPAAVVVDDVGVAGSLDGAGGFVRSNPADAAAYLVVAVGALLAVSSVASALAYLGGGAIVALASAVVVAPALDLLKTVLYGDYRGTVSPVEAPAVGVRAQLSGGVRRGWRELAGFVRSTPGLHALAVGIAAVSFTGGWVAAEPFVDAVTTSIEGRLVGHFPPAAAVEFFGNNWSVAISMAFAGVALVVPAVVSLAFNGLVFGAVAALEENLVALLAFVVPHGIFEIPALFVAAALGFHLGIVGWRTFRGRLGRERFADQLERAFWVLIGVGILLLVAGLVEGFFSPYYWRPLI